MPPRRCRTRSPSTVLATPTSLPSWCRGRTSCTPPTSPSTSSTSSAGSKDGRAELLTGLSDFTVSGVGFTAAELAARPEGAGEIIDAPLSVGSTAIVIARPAQTGWDTETESPCDLTDPFVDPDVPECQTVRGELTGPIRIPAENLGAMIVNLPGDAGGLTTWTHPDLVDSLGTADLIIQNRPTARSRRSEPHRGHQRQHVAAAVREELAPTAWAAIVASDPTSAGNPSVRSSRRGHPAATGSIRSSG